MKKDIQEELTSLKKAIFELANELELETHFLSDGDVIYFPKARFAAPSVNRRCVEELEYKFNLLVDELGYEFKENTSKYVIQKKEKE